jgi:hypothetical protein
MLDAFFSVRTFIPALRQGLQASIVATLTAATGYEGGVALISFFQSGGDEIAWFLFPDPD